MLILEQKLRQVHKLHLKISELTLDFLLCDFL